MEHHPAFLVPKKNGPCLTDIEMEDSETENENGNGRTILHHTTVFDFIIT